jgi:hypothetical protein
VTAATPHADAPDDDDDARGRTPIHTPREPWTLIPHRHSEGSTTTTTRPTMAHIYDIGTRAWQPDTTEGWVASEVSDKQIAGDKVKLVFKLENGEVGTVGKA